MSHLQHQLLKRCLWSIVQCWTRPRFGLDLRHVARTDALHPAAARPSPFPRSRSSTPPAAKSPQPFMDPMLPTSPRPTLAYLIHDILHPGLVLACSHVDMEPGTLPDVRERGIPLLPECVRRVAHEHTGYGHNVGILVPFSYARLLSVNRGHGVHACLRLTRRHHSARVQSPYIVAPRQAIIVHAPRRRDPHHHALEHPCLAHPHLGVSSRTSRALLAHARTCCCILVFELSRTLAAAHHPIHTVVAHSRIFVSSRASRRAVLMSSLGMSYHPRTLAASSAPLLHGRTPFSRDFRAAIPPRTMPSYPHSQVSALHLRCRAHTVLPQLKSAHGSQVPEV
ncbi:hypothetical protein EVG20_g10522 [Dentipellis fragilis]|uniref:Uncharacterized protein n=1 Tax=Dentipellis fragilis TaxID=205917 RepID=A0A4Y9XSX8_9AGAM|nr:hypothetical protein EVG20_g10522 [Dentipellis fragilis]